MFHRRVVLAALFAGAVIPGIVAAQGSRPSAIVGSVFDGASRAPLAGVSVEAVSDINGDRPHDTTTDGDGAYRLTDLPGGTYSLTFTFPEYQTFKREGMALPPGMSASVVALLKPSPTRD
jgi:large repetitive protein